VSVRRDKSRVVHEINFDEQVAVNYDADTTMSDPSVVDPVVEFLTALADDGAALEFGIGTGRIALPLSARGVRVHGIDISPPMVAQLAAKPGAEAIDVTIGDFATCRVDGAFRLVYLVYNTITNLTTQDEQVACFCNAAAHLEPGGCFVIEVGVPDLRRLPPGSRTRVFAAAPTYLGFDDYTDLAAQQATSHHWWFAGGRVGRFSTPFRYVWPSELDLMARLAGLTLRERWSTWTREPFTSESTQHVSVWTKTGEG
jgi:SAM-dependent methyltransferase